jgi:hypothetical protein
VALIKTDHEEGRLQPTPAGHPKLATPRANHFLLVISCVIFRTKTNSKTASRIFSGNTFYVAGYLLYGQPPPTRTSSVPDHGVTLAYIFPKSCDATLNFKEFGIIVWLGIREDIP